MKNFLIILLILVIIGYFSFRYGKKALDKITISEPKLTGVDLASIINTTGFSTLRLTTTVTNGNNFNIPVSNLFLQLYYQGNLIGKSLTAEENFIVPKNSQITIAHDVVISLANSIGIAAKLIAKQPVTFDYNVKATLFNFLPLNYNNSFTY